MIRCLKPLPPPPAPAPTPPPAPPEPTTLAGRFLRFIRAGGGGRGVALAWALYFGGMAILHAIDYFGLPFTGRPMWQFTQSVVFLYSWILLGAVSMLLLWIALYRDMAIFWFVFCMALNTVPALGLTIFLGLYYHIYVAGYSL